MARTILIIDDSPTQMQVVKTALLNNGFRVLTANNGEDGLELALNEKPELVVLNVILPGRNGFQICRDLKTNPETKQTPVVMLTTKDQPSDRFWGMRQGADVYLLKPCNMDELLAAIARLI